MSDPKNEARALRYRRLAVAERDPQASALLRQLADEAERGVLCTGKVLQSAEAWAKATCGER